VSRNVASVIRPPKFEPREIEILSAHQIGGVLAKFHGHALLPIVVLALATGMRRGELLVLRWEDLDLDGATVRVGRSLEETADGLRFKPPKTKHGRRIISLPPSSIGVLRAYRVSQLELRVSLGQGKPAPSSLLFSTVDGCPLSPDNLSRDWRRAVVKLGFPRVMFHALRQPCLGADSQRRGCVDS
jgi:integrase